MRQLASALLLFGAVDLAAQEAVVPPSSLRTLSVHDVSDLQEYFRSSFSIPLQEMALQREPKRNLPELLRMFMPRGEELSDEQLRMIHDRHLLAQLDAEQVQWLTAVLGRARAEAADVITLAARVFAGVPTDHPGLTRDAAPQALADAAAAARFAEELLALPGVRIVAAPKLQMVPFQPAKIEQLDQVSYVKSWRVEKDVQPGGRTIVGPIIEVVRSGVILQARALLLPERQVGLDVTVSLLDLERPIAAATVQVEGRSLEIGKPKVTTTRIDATVSLPAGRTVVLCTPKGQQPAMVVLLSVPAIVLPDARTGDKR